VTGDEGEGPGTGRDKKGIGWLRWGRKFFHLRDDPLNPCNEDIAP